MLLFTDGSLDAESKVGYGAYLLIADSDLSLENLNSQIRLQRFEQTTSSRWAILE